MAEPTIGNYNLNRIPNAGTSEDFWGKVFSPNRPKAVQTLDYETVVRMLPLATALTVIGDPKSAAGAIANVEGAAQKATGALTTPLVDQTMVGSNGAQIVEALKRLLATPSRSTELAKPVPEGIVQRYAEAMRGKLPEVEPVPEYHVGPNPVLIPQRNVNTNSNYGSALHTTPDPEFALYIAQNRGMLPFLNEFYPYKGQNTFRVKDIKDAYNLGAEIGLTPEELQFVLNRAGHQYTQMGKKVYGPNDPRLFLKSLREVNAAKVGQKPIKDIPRFQQGEMMGEALRGAGINRLQKPAAGTQEEIINLDSGGAGNVINRLVLEALFKKLRGQQ